MTKQNNLFSPAMLVGLDSLPGIQTSRVLAQHSIPVFALARFPHHYACKTNTCKKIYFANTQTKDFIDLLISLGPQLPAKTILIPCTDMSVFFISQYRQKLARWYYIALPPHQTVETLMNKSQFYRFIKKSGFPHPKTFVIRSISDAEDAAKNLSYPAVLKPSARKFSWTSQSLYKVLKVNGKKEFLQSYKQVSQWLDEFIVQEWIDGPESNLFSCNLYFNRNSQSLVTFVWQKIRQWPPQIGIVSLGVECHNNIVLQQAIDLFKKSGFYGLAHVEMKYSEKNKEYMILEANIGRPIVCSLAEGAGVELIYTMYSDVVDLPLPEKRIQKYIGVKWIHLHHDLRSAWHHWRKGDLTLLDWIESLKGPKVHALFSWSDPKPFFYDLQQSLFHKAGKLIQSHHL